jgi:hypothetical protein
MVTRYALRIRLQVPADTGDEARSLHAWLAAEPAVRTAGELRVESSEPAGDEMGPVLDAISLVVGSGLSLGQLMVAVAAWRATRPRPYRVEVVLGDRTVAIETSDADEALAIARQLEP